MIRLGLVRKNPLTIPVLLAEHLGLFEKHGVQVNLNIMEDFTFGGNQLFKEGEVDAMVGDVTFFFYILEAGKEAVITSNLTRTIQVVGKDTLTDDLRGLRVGVNRTGLFRLYMENDLKNLLPEAKIVWLNNTYERIEAFKSGEIDALVAIEPFVSDVLALGGKVLWHTKDSDKNLVMWAFDKLFYQQNTQEVGLFHRALEEAQNYFNNSFEEDRVNLCIKAAGYHVEAATRLKDFTFEPQRKFSQADFELCEKWMARTGEIKGRYKEEDCIVDVFN